MANDLCTKQVSVFLENKAGRLADVCRLLGEKGVNIRAFCTADTSDFGILRLIVNDPNLAVKVLRDYGYAVTETDVLVAPIKDSPGGLAEVLLALRAAKISVEYMYAFVTPVEGEAFVIFRVLDEMIERTIEALQKKGLRLLDPEKVYSL